MLSPNFPPASNGDGSERRVGEGPFMLFQGVATGPAKVFIGDCGQDKIIKPNAGLQVIPGKAENLFLGQGRPFPSFRLDGGKGDGSVILSQATAAAQVNENPVENAAAIHLHLDAVEPIPTGNRRQHSSLSSGHRRERQGTDQQR